MPDALLVIDLQRDYFADDELERCRPDLVAATNSLVSAARTAGVPVVEARTEHDPEGSTWTLSMRQDGHGPAMAGTEGAEPVEGLQTDGAQVVVKHRDSAFFKTDLEPLLRSHQVTRVVLAGVSTESCIAATASDAFAHDLEVVVVSDATASIDPSLHEETLQRLQGQYRQSVRTTQDVVGEWVAQRG